MNEQKKNIHIWSDSRFNGFNHGRSKDGPKRKSKRVSIFERYQSYEQRNLNMNYLQRIIATMKEKKITMRETEKESEKIRNLERV